MANNFGPTAFHHVHNTDFYQFPKRGQGNYCVHVQLYDAIIAEVRLNQAPSQVQRNNAGMVPIYTKGTYQYVRADVTNLGKSFIGLTAYALYWQNYQINPQHP
jgi:hypothetical protein